MWCFANAGAAVHDVHGDFRVCGAAVHGCYGAGEGGEGGVGVVEDGAEDGRRVGAGAEFEGCDDCVAPTSISIIEALQEQQGKGGITYHQNSPLRP